MEETEQIKRYKLESQLKALVKEGATLRDIAIRLGCSEQTIRRELRKIYNTPKNPRGGILEWVKSLWAAESFQASVDRGEIELPPTGSEWKASDYFTPGPCGIYQGGRENGLRGTYSAKEYMEERNQRISASMASSGSGMAIRGTSSENSLPCGQYMKPPFWRFR